jgi:hypothetical protein
VGEGVSVGLGDVVGEGVVVGVPEMVAPETPVTGTVGAGVVTGVVGDGVVVGTFTTGTTTVRGGGGGEYTGTFFTRITFFWGATTVPIPHNGCQMLSLLLLS